MKVQLPKVTRKFVEDNGFNIARLQYVRINDVPVGVVVEDAQGNIGWSICHANDRWNKEKGLEKAIWRTRQKQSAEARLALINDVYNCVRDQNNQAYKNKLICMRYVLSSIIAYKGRQIKRTLDK